MSWPHVLPKPSCPVIVSAEEARLRRRIRLAVLDQQAPEMDWTPLDHETTIAKWRESLTPYQKQLHSSFTRYSHAKKEWKQAEESCWQRMTRQAGKLEKICQRLLLEFLAVLRFVVQALLHVVGLRSTPPEPVWPVLMENDRPALESFRKRAVKAENYLSWPARYRESERKLLFLLHEGLFRVSGSNASYIRISQEGRKITALAMPCSMLHESE